MKSIVSLLAIAALSLVSSVVAQEESPSPSPASEEKASATVEAPSGAAQSEASATPAEKSATTFPAPGEKKSPAAKPSPAAKSSPAAKKETTDETSSKSSEKKSTQSTSAADTGGAEPNVKRLENEWETAVMKKDSSFIQARVADDFVGTSSKGKRLNKAGLLKEFKSDADTYTSAKNGSVTVHAFGANVAVATGVAKEVGTGKDGKAFNRTYAWTDTWMLRGSQWQCIGSHAMLMPGK